MPSGTGVGQAIPGLLPANYYQKPGETVAPQSTKSISNLNMEIPEDAFNGFQATPDNMSFGPFVNSKAQTEYSFADDSEKVSSPPPIFNLPVPNPGQPMTKGEVVDRLKDIAQSNLSEGGYKALTGLVGLGHIANGGKVSYSRELDVDGFDSLKMGVSASAKKGGTLGFEIKGSF